MNGLNQAMANMDLESGSVINLSHETLSHQDSVQSMSSQDEDVIIDDSKMVECEQNDSDYLVKENLLTVLKTYKTMLEHLKARKHQSISYHDQNVSDLASFIFQSNCQEQIIQQDHEIDMQIDQINNELKQIIFTNMRISESIEEHELPRNIIVAQLPNELFANLDIKSKFERLFIELDPACKFFYFRIFKRCLIQFEDPLNAILARFELDDFTFLNDKLRIFLTKVKKKKNFF